MTKNITWELTRSYAQLGTKSANEICHLCLAGGPNLPWDVHAGWTSCMSRGRGWRSPCCPKSLSTINGQNFLYLLDLFHLEKVGIGRDIAGAVCFLARLGYDDLPNESRNMAARLRRAHRSFQLYCLANKRSAALRYFSLSFFNLS